MSSVSDPAKGTSPISGTARSAGKDGRFSNHFTDGDIPIIDVADIDQAYASYLRSLNPAAVLNAKQSVTGRKPSYGAEALLQAGIPLVDDLGGDLLELREGEVVEVRGGSVFRSGTLVAEGELLDVSDLSGDSRADERIVGRVLSYSMASADLFAKEKDLIILGQGLPSFTTAFKDKVAVVVSGTPSKETLRSVRRLIRSKNSVVVAVGSQGLLAVKKLRTRAHVVVGDPGPASSANLAKNAEIVLIERPDSSVPGAQILRGQSISYRTASSGLSEADVARLICDHSGASVIVDVGESVDLQSLSGSTSNSFNGHLLVMAQLEDRVINAGVLPSLEKPVASGWLLALLVLVALLTLCTVLLLTPWGIALLPQGISDWFSSFNWPTTT